MGPLLFILYLNDIHFVKDCEFINLLADDTLLAASDKSLEVAINKMNKSLTNIAEFLDCNKLKLNVQKTKCMIIITSKYKYNQIDINNVNTKVYDEKVVIVEEIKYLGFMIDNTLCLKNHFTYIHILLLFT